MQYDPHPPLGRPEVAGWVLGALDRAEAEAFGEHLRSCARCQAAVAEFETVAKVLDRPVPADAPPSGLEARVLAAVQRAAGASPEEAGAEETTAAPPAEATWPAVEGWQVVDATLAGQAPRLEEVPRRGDAGERPALRPARLPRRWHRDARWLTVAAAAVVAGAVVVGLEVIPGAPPAVAATISLTAQDGGTASGTATARQATGGWSIRLTVHNLQKLRAGQFYECWYAGPADRPGHRQLITAGTFTVNGGGSETVTMWSAADPRRYRIMKITAESPGDAGQHGTVVLKGTVSGG